MSVEAMAVVLGNKVGDSTSKLVLLAYANHAAKDGTGAFPGKALVAEYAECDPKTVQRHLRKLEAAGWLHRGDQDLVAHYRADRRPVVYDVAMDDDTRARWAAEHSPSSTPPREDNLPPRAESTPVENSTAREDNAHPRSDDHGGTPTTQRGDKAVTPKPSKTIHHPPSPAGKPAGAISTSAPTPPAGAGRCPAHPNGRANCRRCGTTPRQLAAAAAKQAKVDDRDRRLAAQAERAADARKGPDPTVLREGAARMRQALAEARQASQAGVPTA